MKKNQLKTGVVYAYREGKYGVIEPIVLIDTDKLYSSNIPTYGSGNPTSPLFGLAWQYAQGKTPTVGSGIGYLAVWGNMRQFGKPEMTRDEIRAMLTVTKDEALARIIGEGSRIRPRADLKIVSPRWIIGEWDDVMQDVEDETARQALLAAEAKAASDKRVAETQERIDRLRELKLPGKIEDAVERKSYSKLSGYDGNTGKVELSLGQLDALLGLIRAERDRAAEIAEILVGYSDEEGARYWEATAKDLRETTPSAPEPVETEDDGWTYRKDGEAS